MADEPEEGSEINEDFVHLLLKRLYATGSLPVRREVVEETIREVSRRESLRQEAITAILEGRYTEVGTILDQLILLEAAFEGDEPPTA